MRTRHHARIHELKLPLDHAEPALRQAILKRLALASDALTSFTVFKRAYDARKTSAIQLIYTIDAEVKDEAGVLKRLSKDKHIGPHAGHGVQSGHRGPVGASAAGGRQAGPLGLFYKVG